MSDDKTLDQIIDHLYGEMNPQEEDVFLDRVEGTPELDAEVAQYRKILTAYRLAPERTAPAGAGLRAVAEARRLQAMTTPLYQEEPARQNTPAAPAEPVQTAAPAALEAVEQAAAGTSTRHPVAGNEMVAEQSVAVPMSETLATAEKAPPQESASEQGAGPQSGDGQSAPSSGVHAEPEAALVVTPAEVSSEAELEEAAAKEAAPLEAEAATEPIRIHPEYGKQTPSAASESSGGAEQPVMSWKLLRVAAVLALVVGVAVFYVGRDDRAGRLSGVQDGSLRHKEAGESLAVKPEDLQKARNGVTQDIPKLNVAEEAAPAEAAQAERIPAAAASAAPAPAPVRAARITKDVSDVPLQTRVKKQENAAASATEEKDATASGGKALPAASVAAPTTPATAAAEQGKGKRDLFKKAEDVAARAEQEAASVPEIVLNALPGEPETPAVDEARLGEEPGMRLLPGDTSTVVAAAPASQQEDKKEQAHADRAVKPAMPLPVETGTPQMRKRALDELAATTSALAGGAENTRGPSAVPAPSSGSVTGDDVAAREQDKTTAKLPAGLPRILRPVTPAPEVASAALPEMPEALDKNNDIAPTVSLKPGASSAGSVAPSAGDAAQAWAPAAAAGTPPVAAAPVPASATVARSERKEQLPPQGSSAPQDLAAGAVPAASVPAGKRYIPAESPITTAPQAEARSKEISAGKSDKGRETLTPSGGTELSRGPSEFVDVLPAHEPDLRPTASISDRRSERKNAEPSAAGRVTASPEAAAKSEADSYAIPASPVVAAAPSAPTAPDAVRVGGKFQADRMAKASAVEEVIAQPTIPASGEKAGEDAAKAEGAEKTEVPDRSLLNVRLSGKESGPELLDMAKKLYELNAVMRCLFVVDEALAKKLTPGQTEDALTLKARMELKLRRYLDMEKTIAQLRPRNRTAADALNILRSAAMAQSAAAAAAAQTPVAATSAPETPQPASGAVSEAESAPVAAPAAPAADAPAGENPAPAIRRWAPPSTDPYYRK